MLLDTHHRTHDYLRISLTDACNFRCFYCMPNEEIAVTPNSQLMSTEEILDIAKIFVGLGVRKIRLTGGEPLVRKEVKEIMEGLATLPIQLTITSNGVLVQKHIDTFQQIGMKSINISLDTLHAAKFLALTKRDQFQQVKNNIDLLLDRHFKVKINVVVMQGINEEEILDFVAWTKHIPIHIRFIEWMPFDQNKWSKEKVFSYQKILASIDQAYTYDKLDDKPHATTKKYKCHQHAGTFAVISTMTAPFCSSCNRLRLTADGKMKNCLFSTSETDILTPFRQGQNIIPYIQQNVKRKEAALGGQLGDDYTLLDTTLLENRSMIAIGG